MHAFSCAWARWARWVRWARVALLGLRLGVLGVLGPEDACGVRWVRVALRLCVRGLRQLGAVAAWSHLAVLAATAAWQCLVAEAPAVPDVLPAVEDACGQGASFKQATPAVCARTHFKQATPAGPDASFGFAS